MGEGGGGGLDVVMFPWLAFGHMIPFLQLSKRLAARGHAVTFLSTPRNLARLPPGLPEGAESTADVTPDKDGLVKKACDGLAAPFAAFLAGRAKRPDWIVVDFCHHWLPPIADEHCVPCAMFHIIPAAMNAMFGPRWANARYPRTAPEDFTVPPKWIPFPSTIAFRRREFGWIAGAFKPNASGLPDVERFWRTEERCRLIINRSCHELEPPQLFDFLTGLFRKPTVPAGILPPTTNLVTDDDDDDDDRSEVLQWLDGQPPKSVIYVALGSEAPLSANDLHELALGLELAGVRFLWAIRSPTAGGVLPDGFEQRTRGRGVVWGRWVAQVRVLAHGAVGAFLTHCGWGSPIEGVALGQPLVMLPLVVDQGIIARAMAERGVGVEIARDESDGSFDRDAVAAAVRRVAVGGEREAFASNANRFKDVVGDQEREERYIDELVGYLRRYS
uniref:Glycosyltransferase n=1 Tax=Oryza glumipatula TaxID=40148 RepID=A0A0D9YZT2_9ORYZ